jgi:diguanylate cyclase (GGDEF)-like protein
VPHISARILNRLLWGGFVGFLLLYVLILALPLTESVKNIAHGLIYLLPVSLATAGSVIVCFKVKKSEKNLWSLLAITISLFLASELYWVYFQIVNAGQRPPQPSFSDVTALLAHLLMFVVVIYLARFYETFTVTKVLNVIDAVIVVLLLAMTVWVFYLRPEIIMSGILNLKNIILLIIYPVLDLGLIFIIVANLMGKPLKQWRPWEGSIALFVILLGAGNFSYALISLVGRYRPDFFSVAIPEIFWLTMYFLIFIASVRRLESPRPERPAYHALLGIHARSGIYESIILLSIVGTMPLFAILAIGLKKYPIDQWALIGFGVVLGLCLITRSTLSLKEHNLLLSHTITDPVSGAYNFRFFQDCIETALKHALKHDEQLSLAVIDIDDFANINTLYGHVRGDEVLKAIVESFRPNIRSADILCRIGGDEFIIIMPNTNLHETKSLISRLQEVLRDIEGAGVGGIKFTAGIAGYPLHGADKDELERMADAALYWGKFNGKNQVVVFDSSIVDVLSPQERVKKAEELAYMSTIRALAAAIDARDPYTQHHSENVAALAVVLADELGLEKERIKLIETAAMLHDVGKIGIQDSVLKKPGSLTPKELAQIWEHPKLGQKILAGTAFSEILPWIGAHHEHWDGSGYPDGITGKAIPYESRILAICDAYDAMTSKRLYRDALSYSDALKELRKWRGKQFDPDVTDVFIKVIERLRAIYKTTDGS